MNIFDKIALSFEPDRKKVEKIYYNGIKLDEGLNSE